MPALERTVTTRIQLEKEDSKGSSLRRIKNLQKRKAKTNTKNPLCPVSSVPASRRKAGVGASTCSLHAAGGVMGDGWAR